MYMENVTWEVNSMPPIMMISRGEHLYQISTYSPVIVYFTSPRSSYVCHLIEVHKNGVSILLFVHTIVLFPEFNLERMHTHCIDIMIHTACTVCKLHHRWNCVVTTLANAPWLNYHASSLGCGLLFFILRTYFKISNEDHVERRVVNKLRRQGKATGRGRQFTLILV